MAEKKKRYRQRKELPPSVSQPHAVGLCGYNHCRRPFHNHTQLVCVATTTAAVRFTTTPSWSVWLQPLPAEMWRQ